MAKLGRKMYSHSAAAKYSICATTTQKKMNRPTKIFSDLYIWVQLLLFQFYSWHSFKDVYHPLKQSHAVSPLPPPLRIWQIKAFTDWAPPGKKSHLHIFSKSIYRHIHQGWWIYWRNELHNVSLPATLVGSNPSTDPLPLDRLVLQPNLAPPQNIRVKKVLAPSSNQEIKCSFNRTSLLVAQMI